MEATIPMKFRFLFAFCVFALAIGIGFSFSESFADDSPGTPAVAPASPVAKDSSDDKSPSAVLEQRIEFLEIYCMRQLTRELSRSAPFDASHTKLLSDYIEEMSSFAASQRGTLGEEMKALQAAFKGTEVGDKVRVVDADQILLRVSKIIQTLSQLNKKG